MNSHHSRNYKIAIILVLASLAVSCGVPAQPVTEYPSPNATTSPLENLNLQTASFNETAIMTDTLEGLEVFTGLGSVPNAQGQTLQITATGTSSDYIIEYFKTAKFYFEIRDVPNPPGPNTSPIQSINFSVSDALKADKANLLIKIDLPPETKEKYPNGALYVTVDPVIGEKQQHIYLPTDPFTNQADVEITSQQGSIEGSLYLQNVGLLDAKKTTGPNIPEIISGAGEGIFDFVITGLEPGNNEYRLRGTWSYGLEESAPAEPISSLSPTSIKFDSLPDGTPISEDRILVGNEYLSQGVYIKPGAHYESLCVGITTAIHTPTMSIPAHILTTSLPNDPSTCNKGQILIFFTTPVREVTIGFYHADSDYIGLWGYDKDSNEIVTQIIENVKPESFGKVMIVSDDNNIDHIIFGQIGYLIAITDIYFVP